MQATAAGFQLDEAARAQIDALAQRAIDEHRTPGLAIGVMSEGKIIYAKGFGLANLETGTKVTPDSVFMIGSITKQFTAAGIMALADQGKLAIDDPISTYFPDFPRGKEVMIRQLLTHTSGIHTIMMGPPPTPEEAVGLHTTADVIALIQGIGNLYDFEPGKSFGYSNSNFWLLGAIIEKVFAPFPRRFHEAKPLRSSGHDGDRHGRPDGGRAQSRLRLQPCARHRSLHQSQARVREPAGRRSGRHPVDRRRHAPLAGRITFRADRFAPGRQSDDDQADADGRRTDRARRSCLWVRVECSARRTGMRRSPTAAAAAAASTPF